MELQTEAVEVMEGHDLSGPLSSKFGCVVTIHHATYGEIIIEHDTASDAVLLG
jgi:hypothetical protein